MKDKRVIEFPFFCSLINAGSEADARALFEQLPQPTLADVCGKRELKDMTEEEFEELLKVAGLDSKYIESNDNHNPASMFKKYDAKYEYNMLYTKYWHRDETKLEIEAGAVWIHGNYYNPIQVMRWFIEHSFNVFGEGK